jgi:hypothetical protein
VTRACLHAPRFDVVAGNRHATACTRPKCIGRAVKWAARHGDHALIETIKEDQ